MIHMTSHGCEEDIYKTATNCCRRSLFAPPTMQVRPASCLFVPVFIFKIVSCEKSHIWCPEVCQVINSEHGQTSRCLGSCYQGGGEGTCCEKGPEGKTECKKFILAIKAHPARQQCMTDRYWTFVSDINSFGDFTAHH